ncbi:MULTISPECIES: D-alanyl-D-alanine carboxypeptidase family protein [unclassified Leifsonia]|uniref:D-alanyl-D-alanine carboxypeptidase family protein n=1 Tax=unclassified Leifsonia TaxID=2663824 RepID=UPI0006F6DAB4|nr:MULTISPECIES: hypothetical protein [unclassified Leifsonia]KQX07151.1 hypothetical protein ASC59_04960 [Leifsonia sp. Root1293]KRA11434.1 hypothetical protein ASD61_04960 [Leifsonia sp. Root60]
MDFRPGRFFGILIGVVVILGIGVYGPVTLLAPLPAVTAEVLSPANPASDAKPPTLPSDGASAVIAVGESTPFAVAGTPDAVPIAGIAKVIAALVTIEEKPLAVGKAGDKITIATADYAGYIEYSKEGARTLPVFRGEKWTEQQVLQAVLLGSSNNHADTLVRWAFGSVDAYVETANAWLAKNGMKNTTVADATGLSGDTVGTASDAAVLGALLSEQPTLHDILSKPATALVNARGVENTTDFFSDLGVFGISRSFTDPAGVCYLFTKTIGEGDSAVTVSGAFIRQPDYDTLASGIAAFAESAETSAEPVDVISESTAYVHFRAPWGAQADGVTGKAVTRSAWKSGSSSTTVEVDEFSTKSEGALVGHVRVGDGAASVALKLSKPIRDPGLGWRLMNPIPMVQSLIESQTSGSEAAEQ